MKHKGNISEIQLIRNKEIVRTFIELKKTCTFSYYKDICKEIAGMKAKQHYVSEDRAYVILYRYLTEGNIPDCCLYKYEMYSSLIRCCLDIMKKKSEANLRLIVRLAIERPSDSFGISPDRIQHILWKAGMK